MEFRLLGPVEVRAANQLIDAGPPRQRSVLAALAVDVGQPVMVETVVDRVWGQTPPDRVRHALYVYIARIRRVIGQASAAGGTPAQLVRRSRGYLLDVDPDCIDIQRFRKLVDQARVQQCPDSTRAAVLRQALELWRGAPVADLTGEWAAQLRQGWQQQHIEAVECWARAELRLGNAAAVVGRLTDLIAEHPLIEPIATILMQALHATGRTADALDCYTTMRQRLVEHLGIDPGPELQQLHRQILRRGVEQVAATRQRPESPQAAVPAQLPPDVRGFSGRASALARLDTLLGTADEQPTAVVITALSGTAGVGKTALAVHWARRIAGRFPGGQLYVNLRGFDPVGPPVNPADALRGFLDAFAVPPERIPANLDAQTALFRSLLTGKQVLVVLDNARDAGQVRPLLPGSPGCLALVTSRNQLAGLVAAEGAYPLTLDLLPHDEARQLLTRRLGLDRVAAEPDAVHDIITRCARLPLALAVVAARAATRPTFPLADLAAELHEGRHDLDGFDGGDVVTDVRAVFSCSYQALRPEAARLFRLLGLHPGPDIAPPAVASLAGLPLRQVRTLLAELAGAHLISEHVPDRYTSHDLLRAYAAELTRTLDCGQEGSSAQHRMLDHYLHAAHAAALLLHPHRDSIDPAPPQPGVTVEELVDSGQALAWFAAEHGVLLAMVGHAAISRFDAHTWKLAWTLAEYLDRRGHWRAWVSTQRAALAAARHLPDPIGQAHIHRSLGRAHLRQGRYDEARSHFQRALALFGEHHEQRGQAHTHLDLGWLSDERGDHRQALCHAREALGAYRAIEHRAGQANALNAVGWYHTLLGNHRQAITHCRQALTLQQELDDRIGQADTWDSLGHAHHHLGHYRQAVTCYQHALDLYRTIGRRYSEAATLGRLGDTHRATGHIDMAHTAWQHALETLDELGHPSADDLRTKLASASDRRHQVGSPP